VEQIEGRNELHNKLYNKSQSDQQLFHNPKRVYDMSTTIQQIERKKTGHNKIATGMDGKCPKWQKNCYRGNIHPLRVSNPNWHESSMPVGLPAGEKKRRRSVAYFLSKSDLKQQYKPGAVLALRGHLRSLPMVPFDRRQNLLYFLFPGPCAYLMSFWSYGEKKRKFRKPKLVAMETSLENSKIEVQVVYLQP